MYQLCTIHFVRHVKTYYIKMWFSSPLYYSVSIASRVTKSLYISNESHATKRSECSHSCRPL